MGIWRMDENECDGDRVETEAKLTGMGPSDVDGDKIVSHAAL